MALTLWLSPGHSEEERYGRLIGDLARRFGTPFFSPHITLLSGLPDDIVAARNAATRIVDETSSARFAIPIVGVSTSDDLYRCLVIDLELTDELRRVRRFTELTTGLRSTGEYRPHLSLVYGRLSTSDRRLLSEEIAPSLPTSVGLEWLDVERTEGEVADWRREIRLPLTEC